jgi:hypothetical protein
MDKEYKRKWREAKLAEDPDYFKSKTKAWREANPELAQERNRKATARYREKHKDSWNAYQREYFQTYFNDSTKLLAHYLRCWQRNLYRAFLKSGKLPKDRTNRSVYPASADLMARVIQANIDRDAKGDDWSIHHIISIPHILKFVGVKYKEAMTADVMEAIFDPANLALIPRAENSSRRDYINSEVLSVSMILETKYGIMEGLTDYLRETGEGTNE